MACQTLKSEPSVSDPNFVETRESVRQKLWSGEYLTKEHGGRSTAWKSFSSIVNQDGFLVRYVACKTCGDVFSYRGHSSGTSTLRKHLKKCRGDETEDVRESTIYPANLSLNFIQTLSANLPGALTDDRKDGSHNINGTEQFSSADAHESSCDNLSVDLSPYQILGSEMENPSSPASQRPESYKLSHNNHLSIVLDALAGDESFMDVTLTAEGRSVKAHKSVLSAVSPYFKSVLKANPCQHPIIILPRDISFEQLKYIIMYIYRGEMTVSAEDLPNLLKTAETLQITGLSPSEGTKEQSKSQYPVESSPAKPCASTTNMTTPSHTFAKRSHPDRDSITSKKAKVCSTVVKEKETNLPQCSIDQDDNGTEDFPELEKHSMDEEVIVKNECFEESDSVDAPYSDETLKDDMENCQYSDEPPDTMEPLVCPHCFTTAKSFSEMKNHCLEKHKDINDGAIYPCSCNKIFANQNSQAAHKEHCKEPN